MAEQTQAHRGRVLVVDDQAAIRRLLRRILEDDGYAVDEAEDGQKALALAREAPVDLIITDLKMPRLDGVALLKKVKEESPETVVVLLTAYGTIPSAVEAMKHGAFDYLSKPLSDPEEVRVIAASAMALRRCGDEDAALLADESWELVYADAGMARVAESIRRIAPTGATVLLLGESGTGKEVVARLVHKNSERADRPFLAVNCAALPESLLESELFGHERGAFTGADRLHRGRCEMADQGTLFLDEIGEMSPALQAKMLRFLEDRSFHRVGGTAPIAVDVRIIAATNRDLTAEIAAGRFREDLYYRLNVFPIALPPLRNRGRDAVLLARHFMERLGRKYGRKMEGISPEAEKALLEYSWPGNVRELWNTVERAVLLADGPLLGAGCLSLGTPERPDDVSRSLNLKALEKQAIIAALEQAKGNRRKAADILGIGLRTLHYKLNAFDLRKYLDRE